jgi:hypothetical protein
LRHGSDAVGHDLAFFEGLFAALRHTVGHDRPIMRGPFRPLSRRPAQRIAQQA